DQGARESRVQGEGGQVTRLTQQGRHARCGAPKPFWASYENVADDDYQQLPLSPRRNELPVKRIDWSRLMICEYSTCALIELMQIGKTPSSADPVLHHAPEAFNRIEMVSAMRRQEMQPKLLVPVGQRRCELMRPVDATAVGNHDHLFARVAKEGHHLMDVLAKPLRLKMGHDLVEDFRGAILDCPNHTEQHAAGDPAPGAILHPCLAFEGF